MIFTFAPGIYSPFLFSSGGKNTEDILLVFPSSETILSRNAGICTSLKTFFPSSPHSDDKLWGVFIHEAIMLKHVYRDRIMEFLKQIKLLTDEDIAELPRKVPDPEIRLSWERYFDENKILCTNGKKAWNPYSNPIRWFKINLNPQLLISQFRFILVTEDLRGRRNALLRLKRVFKKQPRLCLCGCGEVIPPTANSTKKYMNDAHSKRFHRG
jgi:hypothetical protein